MTGILTVLLALATGTASALLPFVNAEVYAVAAGGRSSPDFAVLVVAALALGQTAGKLALFEAARRGRSRARPPGRWTERATRALRSRRTGHPVVLASAALGLPPLLVVSLAAGASGQRRWEFALLCLVGRTARFAALALPAAWAWT